MRFTLTTLLILLFILMPAHAQETADVWPAFFGTDNGGPDNGYMVFYDQDAAAWQAPRLVDNDLLDAQWTPQRNGVGYATDGKYNVSFIEATGNDLEIWESPDDHWLDDAGAWAMTDNDASEDWLAVDVETRQNYVYPTVYTIDAPSPLVYPFYIDLAAGVPALTIMDYDFDGISDSTALDDTNYSVVLNQTLWGLTELVFIRATNAMHTYHADIYPQTLVRAEVYYPQVITDEYNEIWVFYTVGNTLYLDTGKSNPADQVWIGAVGPFIVYTAIGLDQHYHAAWLKYDDTIHVVLIDNSPFPNATMLVYLRRDSNGWVINETLLTVDSDPGGDNDGLVWPQITVDPFANIFIYFIYQDTIAVTGDLQGFYLDNDDYDNPVAGSWVRHLNIDQSADVIEWVVAQDSIPRSGDM